jgi:hypothetical protein
LGGGWVVVEVGVLGFGVMAVEMLVWRGWMVGWLEEVTVSDCLCVLTLINCIKPNSIHIDINVFFKEKK